MAVRHHVVPAYAAAACERLWESSLLLKSLPSRTGQLLPFGPGDAPRPQFRQEEARPITPKGLDSCLTMLRRGEIPLEVKTGLNDIRWRRDAATLPHSAPPEPDAHPLFVGSLELDLGVQIPPGTAFAPTSGSGEFAEMLGPIDTEPEAVEIDTSMQLSPVNIASLPPGAPSASDELSLGAPATPSLALSSSAPESPTGMPDDVLLSKITGLISSLTDAFGIEELATNRESPTATASVPLLFPTPEPLSSNKRALEDDHCDPSRPTKKCHLSGHVG